MHHRAAAPQLHPYPRPAVASVVIARLSARSANFERHQVLADPLRKIVSSDCPRRDAKNHALRVVDRRVELLPVEHQEHFQRGVADRLFPSTNGWFRMSENPSAAAFSTSVG